MFIEIVLLIIIVTVISCLFPQSIKFQVQLIALGLLFLGRVAYSKNNIEGMITGIGIKWCEKEKEILFSEIRNISGNKILKILTKDGSIENIFLPDAEVVKLMKIQIFSLMCFVMP